MLPSSAEIVGADMLAAMRVVVVLVGSAIFTSESYHIAVQRSHKHRFSMASFDPAELFLIAPEIVRVYATCGYAIRLSDHYMTYCQQHETDVDIDDKGTVSIM